MNVPFIYHEIYSVPFPVKHRFRMEKFRLLHENLLQNKIVNPRQIIKPNPVPISILELAHSPNYIRDFFHNQLGAVRLIPKSKQ